MVSLPKMEKDETRKDALVNVEIIERSKRTKGFWKELRDVIKTYANNKDNYPVSPVIWLVMVGKMLPVDH